MTLKDRNKGKKLLTGNRSTGTRAVESLLVEVPVGSSWVASIGVVALVNDRLALSVKFNNGTYIGYVFTRDDHISDLWSDWFAAASKGKFLWKWLYTQPYVFLS